MGIRNLEALSSSSPQPRIFELRWITDEGDFEGIAGKLHDSVLRRITEIVKTNLVED